MNKKKEVSLWGAIAICAVAVVIKHLFKLPWHNDPKITGLKEEESEMAV
jgi:hypothetical protein